MPPPDRSDRVWSLACSGADPDSALCLNALSIADLALAWSNGVRKIEIAEHDCAGCARSGGVSFADTLARFNRLALSRGAPILRVKQGPRPRKGWLARLAGDGAPDPARRAILRGCADRGDDDRTVALADFLTHARDGYEPLFPFAPAIDPVRCTGCDACIRGCPKDALRVRSGEPQTYEIVAQACTGCGWCVALCDADAISVATDGPAGAPVPLRVFFCRSCRKMTHSPETAGDGPQDLCNICAEREYSRPDNLVL